MSTLDKFKIYSLRLIRCFKRTKIVAVVDYGFWMFGIWNRMTVPGDIALKYFILIAVYDEGELFVVGSA